MAATLAGRMQWILANRRKSGGDPWDAKALSLAAGLGSSHVGQIARGALKNPQLETLQAIAAAAGVSAAWLATGAGNADSDDLTAPSVSESSTPVHGNVPGWTEVLAEDQRAHSEIDARFWEAGTASAPFLIHGPALPGDALRLARLAMELSDPMRLANALREAQARVRLLESQQGQKAQEFQARVRADEGKGRRGE